MLVHLVALLIQQPVAEAPPMSPERICAVLTDFTARNNKDAPRLLHETTRLDHVDLSCEARTLIFNKTMLVPQASLPAGWRGAYQDGGDEGVCRNPHLRRMVQAGWRISENFTFPDGSRVEFVSTCEREPPMAVAPMPVTPGH